MEVPVDNVSECVPHVVILFLAAKNETPNTIDLQLFEVFGEDVIMQRVHIWFREFKAGRRDVHNLHHDSRPKTSLIFDSIAGVRA